MVPEARSLEKAAEWADPLTLPALLLVISEPFGHISEQGYFFDNTKMTK